jgi:hypothetical protein
MNVLSLDMGTREFRISKFTLDSLCILSKK